jgi:urease alpha subunit
MQALDDPERRPLADGRSTETCEACADGELPACEPAAALPMAQRYFLV